MTKLLCLFCFLSLHFILNTTFKNSQICQFPKYFFFHRFQQVMINQQKQTKKLNYLKVLFLSIKKKMLYTYQPKYEQTFFHWTGLIDEMFHVIYVSKRCAVNDNSANKALKRPFPRKIARKICLKIFCEIVRYLFED